VSRRRWRAAARVSPKRSWDPRNSRNTSAKEAFSKAIGLGMRMPMTWRSAQMLNDPSGKPTIVCSGALLEFMQQNKLSAQVTISDEADYGVAFVIVTRDAST
jgi:holo-[acyl-carrier protein] synthase